MWTKQCCSLSQWFINFDEVLWALCELSIGFYKLGLIIFFLICTRDGSPTRVFTSRYFLYYFLLFNYNHRIWLKQDMILFYISYLIWLHQMLSSFLDSCLSGPEKWNFTRNVCSIIASEPFVQTELNLNLNFNLQAKSSRPEVFC